MLAAAYPYVGKPQRKDSQQVEGDQPQYKQDKAHAVTLHHFSGGGQNHAGMTVGKIEQQIIDHCVGRDPVGKGDEAEQAHPQYERNIFEYFICRNIIQ